MSREDCHRCQTFVAAGQIDLEIGDGTVDEQLAEWYPQRPRERRKRLDHGVARIVRFIERNDLINRCPD